ncbi:MAG: trypsin-like peptidase domain-containing protein [Candidatus Portnoybacteria bacterium]|nr:trypsin-like peptidase domain-containing protein [Candidatus Portnoybacteria bacterium]
MKSLHLQRTIIPVVILTILATGYFLYAQTNKQANYENESDKKITILEQQINDLKNQLEIVSKKAEDKTIVKEETIRREVVREKSQEELLTAAVAKITPSVVSIVVTKDVPLLEIVYENPFGNDPFFKDFGFQIPVYRQKGVQNQKIGAGTGFLISSDGYIITNKHVIQDTEAQYTALLSNGTQQTAQAIYRDPNNDIAILLIPGKNYTSAQLGSSDALQLGQSVFAVGNALGEYSNSVSVGIVSGLDRTIEASNGSTIETLTGVIQTDAAINLGNSGGPLVDLQGKVVGINMATVIGSNSIGFSIPVNIAKNIIKLVLKK